MTNNSINKYITIFKLQNMRLFLRTLAYVVMDGQELNMKNLAAAWRCSVKKVS